MTTPVTLRAVLFDLDGTLADTAPDLAYALNAVREEQGEAPLPFEAIRPVVSHGARALIELGFGLAPTAAGFEALRQRLLTIYQDNIARHTRLFPGMESVLDTLEARGIPWGVVTNKPARLTDPLMDALGLTPRAACIVSGDTVAHSKPHPAPLLHACACSGLAPGACVYVGDAQRDVEAGQAAGMRTLVALFGYLGPHDQPQAWGADGLVAEPRDILAWLGERAA
ncbi:phosphoglycolate phosphatase [Ectothiorhodospiraceae bacterium 2226]|nr:phosphoglycolate phosphatase [Ectothiorhodospiraceae bacterium 2226]